ncbi:MAG: enoyl-CoA hydratase/isomerase family protein [Pseudomonadota bacterium]
MTAGSVVWDVRDAVMTVTLHRPGKLNAIDTALARELLDAIHTAAKRDDVRVVLLRGEGRAFCAGRDVTHAPTDEDLVLVQAVSAALVELPKPVVAAVHGWTLGAGLEWMMNADVVIAAQGTRFRLPEASLGVFVTGGLTATLQACAGIGRAKALMLLGQEFSAAQAHEWGLVWEVVPDTELQAAGERLCAQLAALAPPVAREFKRVLNEVGLAQFKRAIELENTAQRALQG